MRTPRTPAPDLAGLDFNRIEQVLRAAADAAAAMTLPLFRTPLAIDNKWAVGFDPVTEADRSAERAIRSVIAAAFPDHAILGEEDGQSGSGRYNWIIDPVDGTRSFISGVPLWGTLIGFAVDGIAVAGLMNQPFIGETFLAIPGRANYRRAAIDTALRTSGVTTLAEARVFTTTPALFRTAQQRAVWDTVDKTCRVARFGTDCYGYALVASGQADLVIETGLHSYDVSALIPIVEAAGGHFTSWDGGRADAGGSVIAAASEELLDEVLELIATTD